jgi:succinyl-diaminopimelate desuccinylase
MNMDRICRWIDDNQDGILDTLQRWIAIPSVKAGPAEGAPFGREVGRALDAALRDGETMGFATRNLEGYAGDIRMGPLDTDPLAILTHLDIVPVGDGWTADPFAGAIDGERVFGRGAVDDKGPGVAALYAMKAVTEAGIPLRREVRLILGCDEESGMGDMAYYKEHHGLPREGFSPDATYPVINTEKGGLVLKLTALPAAQGLRVKRIAVGERHNVIPGEASALIEGGEALCGRVNGLAKEMAVAVKAEMTAEGVLLKAKGIAGHASLPELAKNAIGELLLMLRALGVQGPLKALADHVGAEYDGDSLGVACSDRTSGALTCNLGILRCDQSGLYAELDIRFPLLCDGTRVANMIQSAFGDTVDVETLSCHVPHHVPENSRLVTALLDAYHTQTGRPKECLAIGGGTYARCLAEGVAFGATFPEEKEMAHQADEYIRIDTLMQTVKIIARAIVLLAGE